MLLFFFKYLLVIEIISNFLYSKLYLEIIAWFFIKESTQIWNISSDQTYQILQLN